MDLWLIVPAKPFDEGKSRLADTLLPSERAAVNQKMLTQVLTTATAANVFTGIIVISRSQHVLDHANKLGAIAIHETLSSASKSSEEVDLTNLSASSIDTFKTLPSIKQHTQPRHQSDTRSDAPSCSASNFFARNAAEQRQKTDSSLNNQAPLPALPKEYRLINALVQARQAAVARGAEAILVLPVDLPLLTIDDVRKLYKLGAQQRGVVIAGSQDGGTNALLLRPPMAIDFAFGTDSFQRHSALAQLRGYPCQTLQSTTLAFDLDGPEDWKRYQESVQALLKK